MVSNGSYSINWFCFNLFHKMNFLKEISPREYQQKIFETCKEKNCLVVLPTGLGKTLIALMLTIERMRLFPGEKAIFLAPTKPLAEQHETYFKKHLPELFADIQLFTGAINAEKRKQIWKTADIIFSTPQCVSNDLQKNLYTLDNVCLLIEDEAHRCIRNYDYNLVAQKYKDQAKHQRILGLTASPGSEKDKIKEICKNLSIEEVELRTRDSDDVKKYLQKLIFEMKKIGFPPEFEEMKQILEKLCNSYTDELKYRKLLFEYPSKTNLINLQKKFSATIKSGGRGFNILRGMLACANAIKLRHATELLETQTLQGFNQYLKELMKQAEKAKSKGVVQLVKKPEFNYVLVKSNEMLGKKTEHPKINHLFEIVKEEKTKNENLKIIVFSQFRETAKIISKKLNELKGVNAKVFVGQAKKTISSEETGLSQKEQKEIIEEFSSGKINVICSTSIGEEGLDIPEVNVVIFYEPVASAIRAIQRAGRTARLMKGKLIMLITKNTKDETYYYASRRKERKMHLMIDSVKEELNNKIKEEKQTTL